MLGGRGRIRYLFVETEAEEIIKNVSDVEQNEVRGGPGASRSPK